MLAYVLGTVLPEVQEGGPPAMVVTHGLAIKWWVGLQSEGKGALGGGGSLDLKGLVLRMDTVPVTPVYWALWPWLERDFV